MDLKVLSIHEKGSANAEYVLISVLRDCDLRFYALADTTYTGENAISNKLRHFYWWAPKAVKEGSLILLRTTKGVTDSYIDQNGRTVHRFFWGLDRAVWNNDGDAAVLFQVKTWNTTRA